LAERYGVLSELSPLFNFQLDSLGAEDGEDSSLLTKEQAIAARKRLNPETLPKPAKQKPQQKIQALSPTEEQPRKKAKVATVEESSEGSSANEERDRSILMSIFLSDAPEQIPDLLKTTQEKSSFNIDMVIDEQGHTALHWAIALARSKIAEQLVARGANIACTSYAGETPLMRGVMVTNSYDVDTFPKSFDLLRESVSIVDNKKRSVLHHVALTAGIQGRMNAAIYYMKIILENLLEGDEKLKSIINAQDSLGDTALNIAARLECQPLVDLLIEAGAIKSAENNNGLQANDYSDKVKPHKIISFDILII
jgi:ankyrin repeat protein